MMLLMVYWLLMVSWLLMMLHSVDVMRVQVFLIHRHLFDIADRRCLVLAFCWSVCHHVTFLGSFRLALWMFDGDLLSALCLRLGMFRHHGVNIEWLENGQIFVDIMSILTNQMRVFLLFTHDRLSRSLLRPVHNKVVMLLFMRRFRVLIVQMTILRLRMSPSFIKILRLMVDTFD